MTARRRWAWPLVPLYAAGLAAKDGLRAAGVLPVRRLKWPVVSVGSLSAGGAGKTPVVIALVKLLQERGWCVDVLSRGYRREGKAVERVAPTALEAGRRFGDEPVLIAKRTGTPVWLASERFLAGEAAEAASETAVRCVHVLDDGFQHRQLARGVDLVLVTAADLEDGLLPAGNLREPLRALKRADVAVIREDEQGRVEERVRRLMRPGALLWTVRRELQVDAAGSAGPRPMAFCAIARPEGFVAMLADALRPVVKAVFFKDHHRYEMADIERIVRIAQETKATGFVVTEKDEVKLSVAMYDRLRSIGPVCAVPLQAAFVEADRVARELEARIS